MRVLCVTGRAASVAGGVPQPCPERALRRSGACVVGVPVSGSRRWNHGGYASAGSALTEDRPGVDDETLVARAAPFARIRGERRDVGAVDQHIRALERVSNGGHLKLYECVQREAGVDDSVNVARLEATQ